MLYQLSYASEEEPEPCFRLSPASHTNPFRFNGTIIEVIIGVSEAQGRGALAGEVAPMPSEVAPMPRLKFVGFTTGSWDP